MIETNNIYKNKFNISEIFYSIQGEGSRAGIPCVFVRLQGCNLRCKWCDTGYALQIGKQAIIMTGEEILKQIEEYDCPFIEFTGGEPLLQTAVLPLMTELCDKGFTVAIETGGSLDASSVDSRVIRIIDVKCPGSGSLEMNDFVNLDNLRKTDEIKFVLADRTDYEWAKQIVDKYKIIERASCAIFSPVFGAMNSEQLATWILEDRLRVRLQLQLHKYIWHPKKRGV